MNNKISERYFIGRSLRQGKWASVYTYRPHTPEILQLRGQISAVVSLESPPDFAVATAGNMLLDFLHESYFENREDTVLVALEKSVLATIKRLQQLMQNDDNARQGIEMQLLVTVIYEEFVYIVNTGSGVLYVLRDGNLQELVAHLQDPTGKGIITEGSFQMQDADVFILGTQQLDNELTKDEILDMCVDFSEKLLKQREFENESLISALIIANRVDREEARKEVIISEDIQEEVSKAIDELEEKSFGDDETNDSENLAEDNLRDDGIIEEDESISNHDIVDENELHENNTQLSFIKEKFLLAKVGLINIIHNINSKRKSAKLPLDESNLNSEVTNEEALSSDNINNKDDITALPTYKVILIKIKNILLDIARKLKTTVWDKWLGMADEGVYVKGGRRAKKKKIKLIILIIAIVLLLVYFSINRIASNIAQNEMVAEAEGYLATATQMIDGVELQAQGSLSSVNKQELQAELDAAQTELDKIDSIENYDQSYDDEIAEQEARIEDIDDKLTLTISVVDPKKIIDFGVNFPGANISDMVVYKSKIYAIDKQYNKLYEVSLDGSNPREVTNDTETPKTLTVDDQGQIIFLDEMGDKRLAIVNTSSGSISRVSGSSEFRTGGITDMVFSEIQSGRIYAIDQSNSQIVFFQRSGSSYGIPEKRLEMDEISTATDLSVIDNKIYFLADINQGLYRANGDQDDTPTLTGLEPGEDLYNATALFVDGLYTYIGDPVSKKVLVFNKGVTEMTLKGQYTYRGDASEVFTDIKALSANTSNNKIFVLDGSTVFELDLGLLESL